MATQSLTPVQQEQSDYYDYELPPVQSWPQLVGTKVDEAQTIIAASPGIKQVVLVLVGQATTDDWIPTRVRIYYTKPNLTVAQTPKIG